MKNVLFLLLISFQASAGVSPEVVNSVDEKKTVTVAVTNETNNPIHCRWSVSWFESLLSYKRFHGDLDIAADSTEKLEFENDPYSNIYRLKSKFDCL